MLAVPSISRVLVEVLESNWHVRRRHAARVLCGNRPKNLLELYKHQQAQRTHNSKGRTPALHVFAEWAVARRDVPEKTSSCGCMQLALTGSAPTLVWYVYIAFTCAKSSATDVSA
jgi:hypothetical protein